MPANNFKPFSTAGGANVLTQAEYEALAALSTGWTSGKASSKEVNKAVRQATFIAAAIAQFVADKSNQDVLDDGNLAGFGTKLIAAINQTSQPLDATLTALAGLVGAANKLPYFNGDDTAALTDLTSVGRDIIGKNAIADVLTYLGLSEVVLGDDCSFTGFAYGDETKPYLKRRSDDLIVLLQPFDETLAALAGLSNSANKLPYFTDTDKMAVADLSVFMRGILGKTSAATSRQYLELAEASTREVGTGANQIPDMSSFSSSLAVQGHAKEPSGLIRQWLGGNTGGIPAGGEVVVTFPFPFPNELLAVVPYSGSQQAGFEAVVGIQWVNRSQIVLYNSSMTKPVTDYGYIAYGK
ncbi:gp53-like domain-containing protein [Yokenella regensburgei]|uniref:gp53-like domain-containing protein n=1 Tax=Yokenella regensburgei TaxID=158877 RepID=UPI003ED8F64A